MHIDINSCFATIEQQANPLLRGKPIAVTAHQKSTGVILAPSIEAKECGVETGMRFYEGRGLCPQLVAVAGDPNKYRYVHLEMKNLLGEYTDALTPKSIDEFVLNFSPEHSMHSEIKVAAREIKKRIKAEIGEHISVSVGVGPSRFIAKIAAGVEKPDGLVEINKKNHRKIYGQMDLTDLWGINKGYKGRLNSRGIFTVIQFLDSTLPELKSAFRSVNSYYWYRRLRGWEIDNVDFARRSYGNSYSFPDRLRTPAELSPILSKLTNKSARRMRAGGYTTAGVHLAVSYRDGRRWHKAKTLPHPVSDTRDIYKALYKILCESPYESFARKLAVSCFGLIPKREVQLNIFENVEKRQNATIAMDSLNDRWGDYAVTTGNMLNTGKSVPDRIAFGGVRELTY